MTLQEKALGQVQTSSLGKEAAYTPPTGTTGIIKTIVISNTSTSSLTFSIYHDITGSATTGDSHALYKDIIIGPNTTLELDSFKAIQGDGSKKIEVEASAINSITFTLFGAEVTV